MDSTIQHAGDVDGGREEGNSPPVQAFLSAYWPPRALLCRPSPPWWTEILKNLRQNKPFSLSCAHHFYHSNNNGTHWLQRREIVAVTIWPFCNGLWEDLENIASAGSRCLDYLNQSLMGDSGESSKHQNAGNNVDSDDCLCHFRWEEKLLEIWQANSCVTLGPRTYLYFCPCFEIVVALSLKIISGKGNVKGTQHGAQHWHC